ncbi:MAG: DUF2066 domain-containing protein [Pseudomonadota bacterium]
MMRYLNLIAATLVLISSAIWPAAAQIDTNEAPEQNGALEPSAGTPNAPIVGRSIFAVRDLAIDINASSAAAARRQAIAQARRIAFSTVFARLVAFEDLGLEPALTNAELARLVSAVDISGEKSSAKRYAAILSVTFDEDALMRVFEKLGVTYTDAETPPIVVLPVVHYGGVDMLWSDDNVWRAAWVVSATRNQSLVNYQLLEPSFTNLTQLNPLTLPQLPAEQAISVIRQSGASDIVVAYARVFFDPASRSYLSQFDVRRGPQQSPFMDFALTQRPTESPAEMLERAIAQIDAELSALWKRQLLVEYAQAADVTVAARFETPAQWSAIQTAFNTARRVRDVSLSELKVKEAEFTARFFGDFEPLVENLAAAGIAVERNAPNAWSVRPLSPEESAERDPSEANTLDDYVDPLQSGLNAAAANSAIEGNAQAAADTLNTAGQPPGPINEPVGAREASQTSIIATEPTLDTGTPAP